MKSNHVHPIPSRNLRTLLHHRRNHDCHAPLDPQSVAPALVRAFLGCRFPFNFNKHQGDTRIRLDSACGSQAVCLLREGEPTVRRFGHGWKRTFVTEELFYYSFERSRILSNNNNSIGTTPSLQVPITYYAHVSTLLYYIQIRM